MSLEANKAIIRRLYEEMNTRNLAARLALLDEVVAPDFVEHTEQLRGRDAFKQFHTEFTEGFSDIHRTIEDIIAEGDKVWIRVTYAGTHTGEFRGLAPTGKKAKWTTVQIYRIADGKFIERWAVSDSLELLNQLGVIEYTDRAKILFPEDAS